MIIWLLVYAALLCTLARVRGELSRGASSSTVSSSSREELSDENDNEQLMIVGGPDGNYLIEETVEVLGLALTVSTLATYSTIVPSYSEALSRMVSLPLLSNISHASNYLSLLQEIRLQRDSRCIINATFCVDSTIVAKGSHGVVYRGRRLDGQQSGTQRLVFKRMHVARPPILRCAAREVYFGKKLTPALGGSHIARFETSFMHEGDMWLVFRDEGVSLQSLMYVIMQSSSQGGASIMKPSLLWERIRTTEEGSLLLKGLMHQIIAAVEELHRRKIVHRDLKPSNILLNSDDSDYPRLLLADFSSASNEEALADLFGSEGPSVDELTLQYAPPEVLLSIGSSSEGHADGTELPPVTLSYDTWSIGVILLELILGSAEVFTLTEKQAARVKHRLRRSSVLGPDKELKDQLLLSALAEFCIHTPYKEEGSEGAEIGAIVPLGADGCSMQEAILKRDSLGLGVTDIWTVDLLTRLLRFRPQDRITASDALTHAYFKGPHISAYDRSEHAFERDRDAHDRSMLTRYDNDNNNNKDINNNDENDNDINDYDRSKKQLITISSIISDSGERSHLERSSRYHRELLLLKKSKSLNDTVIN